MREKKNQDPEQDRYPDPYKKWTDLDSSRQKHKDPADPERASLLKSKP
jgi:hypothetical protein